MASLKQNYNNIREILRDDDAPTIEYGAHLLGQYGNALCISGENLDGDYATT